MTGRRLGIPKVKNRIDILREVRQDTGAALHLTKQHMKEGSEQGKRKAQFSVEDFVWLDGSDFRLKWLSEKLGDQSLGPFEILEKVGDSDY
ncbi:hypothetical protein PQX77_022275 [Marasmius sp. AFHP31]|nr:hypothetical protein PQX77_022275 [Marasmius sp. AFHP31]